MTAELSHALPWLAVNGNRIVRRDTATPVYLRGVNRSGLEYSEPGPDGFFAAARFQEAEFDEIIHEWQANILRIPFNQEWALHGCSSSVPPASASDYLATLDRVIEAAARRGAYTLLDLHWLDARQPFGHLPFGQLKVGPPNFVPPLPDVETPALWQLLAERYRHEPAVLFDLLNEPHSPLSDDNRPLSVTSNGAIVHVPASRRIVTAAEWLPWAIHLTDIIRQVSPDALIFVSGVDWGHDLRQIHLNRPNIVYSAHVYPGRSPLLWQSCFGHLAGDRPLFIGEWGGGADDLDWGHRLHSFLKTNACGWTAWSWIDQPFLVEDARHADYRPTPFGALVKDALACTAP